jgi:hypothetical protein
MPNHDDHILDIGEVPKFQEEQALHSTSLQQLERVIRIGSIIICIIWIMVVLYFFFLGIPLTDGGFMISVLVFFGLIFPIFFSQYRLRLVSKPAYYENELQGREVGILTLLGFFGMLISIFWVVLVGFAVYSFFPNSNSLTNSDFPTYFLLVVFYVLSIGILNILQLFYYPYALNLIYKRRKMNLHF